MSNENYINENILNIISPINIKFHQTSLLINERYAQALIITKYPTFPDYGWLSKIANLEGTTGETTFFPTDAGPLTEVCNAQIHKYRTDLNGKLEESERQLKEKQVAHVKELIKRIGNDELIGYVSTVLLVQAQDEKTLRDRVKHVKNKIVAMEAACRVISTYQKDGYLAVTPYGIPNTEICNISERNMPLSTLLGGFFNDTTGLNDQEGIKIGHSDGRPVILNDWIRENDRTNGNWVVTGISGMGKSTFIKLMIICQFALGRKIIINDPEGEYVDLVKNLGGKIIECGGGRGRINILQVRPVPRPSEEDEDEEDELYKDEGNGISDVAFHFQTFRQWLRLYKSDLKDIHIAKVERILEKTYEKFHITWNTDISKMKPEDFPIFQNLYEDIREEFSKNTNDLDLKYLVDVLYSAAYGADSMMINGHTTITMDTSIILLSTGALLNAEGSIMRSQSYNINTWVWQVCVRDRNEMIIYVVDEGYNYLDSDFPQNMKFLKIFTKRIRKYMGAFWFITHEIGNMLEPSVRKDGQAILDTACYKFLMGTDGKNLEETKEVLGLTEKEVKFLKSKRRRKGILFAGSTRFEMTVSVPDRFLELMGKGGGK